MYIGIIALLEVAAAYSDVPSIPVYSEKIVVAHPIKRKVVNPTPTRLPELSGDPAMLTN